MKLSYLSVILFAAAIGFGIWAFHNANNREFDVVFGTSGEEALQWAEEAKKDRWIEIVELKVLEEGMEYVPVSKKDIDAHVHSNDSILVRRWLSNETGAVVTGSLTQHGYPDMAGLAQETQNSASRQQKVTIWLTLSAVILGLFAIVTAVFAARKRTANQQN